MKEENTNEASITYASPMTIRKVRQKNCLCSNLQSLYQVVWVVEVESIHLKRQKATLKWAVFDTCLKHPTGE